MVFDLDNTLVRTDAANTAAYRSALLRVGFDTIAYGGRIMFSVVRMLFPEMSTSDHMNIVRFKEDAYARFLPLTKPGAALRFFRNVYANRRSFAKIVLLTDAKERRARETLRAYGLETCFDELVCNGGRGDKYANYFATHDTDPPALPRVG